MVAVCRTPCPDYPFPISRFMSIRVTLRPVLFPPGLPWRSAEIVIVVCRFPNLCLCSPSDISPDKGIPIATRLVPAIPCPPRVWASSVELGSILIDCGPPIPSHPCPFMVICRASALRPWLPWVPACPGLMHIPVIMASSFPWFFDRHGHRTYRVGQLVREVRSDVGIGPFRVVAMGVVGAPVRVMAGGTMVFMAVSVVTIVIVWITTLFYPVRRVDHCF